MTRASGRMVNQGLENVFLFCRNTTPDPTTGGWVSWDRRRMVTRSGRGPRRSGSRAASRRPNCARCASGHRLGQVSGTHQVQVQLLHVAEVEEVALPFDLSIVQPEPAAADAVDLRLVAVGIGCHLLPEADDLADLVVDDHLLIRVAQPSRPNISRPSATFRISSIPTHMTSSLGPMFQP